MSTQENNQYSPTSGNQHISIRGIKLIKDFESLRLKAYRCPAGVWTIGYGHTAGVRPHDTIDVFRSVEQPKTIRNIQT